MTILFVCTGNICRSPMAEVFFRKYAEEKGYTVKVVSAGIHGGVGGASEHAKNAVKEEGLSLEAFKSTLLERELVEEVDWIIPLTKDHGHFIEMMFPESKGKLLYLSKDVSDPYGRDEETYRKCFKEIQELIKEISWEEIE